VSVKLKNIANTMKVRVSMRFQVQNFATGEESTSRQKYMMKTTRQ
jgi:hypothetical protein